MGEAQGEECGSVGPRGSPLPKHRQRCGGTKGGRPPPAPRQGKESHFALSNQSRNNPLGSSYSWGRTREKKQGLRQASSGRFPSPRPSPMSALQPGCPTPRRDCVLRSWVARNQAKESLSFPLWISASSDVKVRLAHLNCHLAVLSADRGKGSALKPLNQRAVQRLRKSAGKPCRPGKESWGHASELRSYKIILSPCTVQTA